MSRVGASERRTHLVVEAAGAVQVLEELRVHLVAPEVHARDLEVAPDCMCAVSIYLQECERGVRTVAEVIRVTAVVGHVPHRVVGCDVLRVFLGEICMQRNCSSVARPGRMVSWSEPFTVSQRVGIVARNSYIVIVKANGGTLVNATREQRIGSVRTVSLVVVFHVQEGVEVNIAVEVHIGPMSRSEHDRPAHIEIRTLPASTTYTAATADACRRTMAQSDAWLDKSKRRRTPELNRHIFR